MTGAQGRSLNFGTHVCCFTHFPLLRLCKRDYLTGETVGCKYPFAHYAAGPPLDYIVISYISAPRDSQAHSLNQTTEVREQTTENRRQIKKQTRDKRRKRKMERGKNFTLSHYKSQSHAISCEAGAACFDNEFPSSKFCCSRGTVKNQIRCW